MNTIHTNLFGIFAPKNKTNGKTVGDAVAYKSAVAGLKTAEEALSSKIRASNFGEKKKEVKLAVEEVKTTLATHGDGFTAAQKEDVSNRLADIAKLSEKVFSPEAKRALKAKVKGKEKNDQPEITSSIRTVSSFIKAGGLAAAKAKQHKPQEVVEAAPANHAPAEVITTSMLVVDGVEIDERDVKAIRLARAAFPLVTHLYEVLKTGGEFVPSKLYEAGEGCAKLFAGEDGAEALAVSMIPAVLEMMRLMDVEGEDTVASVHAIVDQLDAARDAWVAASVRSLQSKAEAAVPVEPAGATEKARQVNQQVGSRRRGK